MKETKVINGEEHYQLGVTGEWVEAHPVPELHRGLKFYSTSAMSPVFIVEGNDPDELERHPTMIPGGIPEREERGEYYLLYVPSSGSEPLRWRQAEFIRESFQCGQYRLEPIRMAKDRGIDSEAWWQPIIENDMTEYDFIDTDAPEKRAEDNDEDQKASGFGDFHSGLSTGGEDTDANSDKVAEENSSEETEDNRGFLGRGFAALKNAL
jgi:hypothetical protein